MEEQPLELTFEEIRRITRYSRADCQLRVLEALHIPACKRRDNTVLVMRMHCMSPAASIEKARPALKPIRK